MMRAAAAVMARAVMSGRHSQMSATSPPGTSAERRTSKSLTDGGVPARAPHVRPGGGRHQTLLARREPLSGVTRDYVREAGRRPPGASV